MQEEEGSMTWHVPSVSWGKNPWMVQNKVTPLTMLGLLRAPPNMAHSGHILTQA